MYAVAGSMPPSATVCGHIVAIVAPHETCRARLRGVEVLPVRLNPVLGGLALRIGESAQLRRGQIVQLGVSARIGNAPDIAWANRRRILMMTWPRYPATSVLDVSTVA